MFESFVIILKLSLVVKIISGFESNEFLKPDEYHKPSQQIKVEDFFHILKSELKDAVMPAAVIVDGAQSDPLILETLHKLGLPQVTLTLPVKGFGNDLVPGYSKNLHSALGFGLVLHTLNENNHDEWKSLDLLSKSFTNRINIIVDNVGGLTTNIPEKIHSKTIIIRRPNIVTLVCPGRRILLPTVIKTKDGKITKVGQFESCPNPLEGQVPTVSSVGGDPHLLAYNMTINNEGRLVKTPWLEEGTGNHYGVDYNLTELIGFRFKTNHFRLFRNPEYDHFDKNQGRWHGRAADVIEGKVDFTLGFAGVPMTTLDIVDYSNYVYFNQAGISSGHSKIITSLFNIVLPFR